ncbi:MAG: hypothetical protein JNM09_26555 [Blastocatellia bacterium]|nr:hypothetical protein [Blastocatellia bacterium]
MQPIKSSVFILLGILWAACFLSSFAQSSTSAKAADKPAETETKPSESGKASDINLLGKADTAAGESRRNENVQFNLIDNYSLKEANLRLGTTATIIREFAVDRSYFGSEFGTAPKVDLTIPAGLKSGFHGQLRWMHLNSIFSARSFFQVGTVKPARENDYGFNFGTNLRKNTKLFVDIGQLKIRGNVNGNVLVPRLDERTALTNDPATRAIVLRFLSAYPLELPNRTDINPRALNTNSLQTINNHQANFRIDQTLTNKDGLALQYQFTNQNVQAFQLVAGQNPNTDTKSHVARLVWTRQWSPTTLSYLTASYDRVTSVLLPDDQAVGPYVSPSGLTSLGPDGSIPIDRAQNQVRFGGQLRRGQGRHTLTTGFGIIRRQLNGRESDVHRGYFSFTSEFEKDANGNDVFIDAVTNLRRGRPALFLISLGHIHRGFRNWDMQFYGSDSWQINQRLTLQFGLRYQPTTAPVEVNDFNQVPYDSDLNNVAPSFGFAYRMPENLGVMRGAFGVHFGEIFPPTFQQIRYSPPLNNKINVNTPNLVTPLASITQGGQLAVARSTLYTTAPELALPYSYQYNLSWEPEFGKSFSKFARLQFGYVGSRSHKLFVMWYLNRAHAVPGIAQTLTTINQRRANPDFADIRYVVNTSNGYFDAGRVSLVVSNWHGLTTDVAYWFSKAMDLGSNYLNNAYENDSRSSRSQSEFENHRDMKGLSLFDQTHAFLWRVNYLLKPQSNFRALDRITNGWTFSAVVLVKTGIPFNVVTGSDAPGFGNVDGNGNDRPNLLDPSILGRTIANPDTSKQLLPRAAFGFINPTGASGNLGRNVFRKGPIRNVNASLARTWSFKKDVRLTFRAESVNLFNTPQFAEPGFELSNPNFGLITNTLNDGRTFRFGLQIGW